MARRRKKTVDEQMQSNPAITVEGRENQLINLAVNLAEEQLRNGTASSQIITHFLKLGSTKNELEKEKIAQENLLIKAKIDALESTKRVEELYENAIKAMKTYGGNDADEYDEYDG